MIQGLTMLQIRGRNRSFCGWQGDLGSGSNEGSTFKIFLSHVRYESVVHFGDHLVLLCAWYLADTSISCAWQTILYYYLDYILEIRVEERRYGERMIGSIHC